MGHYTADDGKYRPAEEGKYRKEKRDPIVNIAKRLLDEKEVSQEGLYGIHDKVRKEAGKAFKFAGESAPGDVENMFRGVYYNSAVNE